MYIVAYDEDWWLPDRTGFTQLVRQPLDARRSLLVTLVCSPHISQPIVQKAGIHEGCEHPDGPYWRLVESVPPAAITLRAGSRHATTEQPATNLNGLGTDTLQMVGC